MSKGLVAEKIFAAEAEIILDICSKESCVIVGRCADYILKSRVKTLSVFITASLEKRIQTAEERHGIVLAKNQLAKAAGVKTGECIWEAKQKTSGTNASKAMENRANRKVLDEVRGSGLPSL